MLTTILVFSALFLFALLVWYVSTRKRPAPGPHVPGDPSSSGKIDIERVSRLGRWRY
jgi:hypothetical protein